jgi:hypothetical protein
MGVWFVAVRALDVVRLRQKMRRLQWIKKAVLLLRCEHDSEINWHSKEAVKTDGKMAEGCDV